MSPLVAANPAPPFDVVRVSHVELGVEVATRYGENPLVVNCIAAHHDDVPHETEVSVLVQAASITALAQAWNDDHNFYKEEQIRSNGDGVDADVAGDRGGGVERGDLDRVVDQLGLGVQDLLIGGQVTQADPGRDLGVDGARGVQQLFAA